MNEKTILLKFSLNFKILIFGYQYLTA